MNKDYREQLAKLQELLNSVSYKYKIEFDVRRRIDPFYFLFKAILYPECAYKRDGRTKIEILLERQYPIYELDYIIQNFNRWIRDILLIIEKHELDEWLLINGERVFDPHEK